MKRSPPSMNAILEAQVQMLATTRRPKTVKCYRYCVYNFLAYLHTTFLRLHKLSQLRRDPHLLAWFRFLCQQYPSPGNRTRHLHLLTVRCLLQDLVNQGHPDFPPSDHYLPKPLSLEASCPPRESVSVNASISPWIAYNTSVNCKWRFVCLWASSIPNLRASR
jgi:hypothetical protein